jgi:hypothetical protein
MKYPMLICRDPAFKLTPEQRGAMLGRVDAWADEMEGRSILLPGGHELRPGSDGRTVRVRSGDVLISDGPFAETKEQIGGFDIVDCASLDEALEVAAKHPCWLGASGREPWLWRAGHVDPRACPGVLDPHREWLKQGGVDQRGMAENDAVIYVAGGDEG